MKNATVARAAGTQTRQAISGPMMAESRPVNTLERGRWSGRYGHEFSRVRIFEGPESSRLTSSFGARGLAIEADVVLGKHSDEETLGHELAHVAQTAKGNPEDRERAEAEAENGTGALQASAPPGEAQFDEDEPRPVPALPASVADPVPAATPDPAASGATTASPSAPLPSAALPFAAAATGASALPSGMSPFMPTYAQMLQWGLLGAQPSMFSRRYDLISPPPLFTPGAGPATPRGGTGGDIAKALLGIPALGNAANAAGSQVTRDLSRAWQGSDAWGRSAMLAGGAGMAGLAALPLILPRSRQAAAATPPYSFLQNTDIPIGPGSFHFNLAGHNQNFGVMLDLARLIPGLR